jgi:hypothetical protein
MVHNGTQWTRPFSSGGGRGYGGFVYSMNDTSRFSNILLPRLVISPSSIFPLDFPRASSIIIL